MLISIPVSLGELVDKITILQIKARHLRGEALGHVQQELALLQQALQSTGVALDPAFEAQLLEVNGQLWEIEDAIREQERQRCHQRHLRQLRGLHCDTGAERNPVLCTVDCDPQRGQHDEQTQQREAVDDGCVGTQHPVVEPRQHEAECDADDDVPKLPPEVLRGACALVNQRLPGGAPHQQ